MKIKISELKNTIEKVYKLSQDEKKYISIMIWGAPGVGKSAAVRQIAKDLKIDFIDLRLSLLNPVDLRGLPSRSKEGNKATWLIPDFLPNGNHKKNGILFLDEINLAPQSVMSAGYQLILDRKLGNYQVPEGWIIVAAGNRAEDQAAVTKFPAPLANRFIHLELPDPDVDEWKKWAMGNGIVEEVVAFLKKMPQHLFKFPKAGEKAWASPRSWEFASNLFRIGERIDSAVGEGVASEFYAYLRVYEKMPDIEDILNGKEKSVPKEHDILYAVSMALAFRAKEEHLDNVFDYIARFPSKEFEVLSILSMADRSDEMKNAIVQNSNWTKWIKDNKEIIEE